MHRDSQKQLMSKLPNLHLLIPGLLGPMPTLDQLQPQPGFKLLERLFARSDRQTHPGDDLESVLFGLFGISSENGGNLPTAAYRRIGDGGTADSRYWLQLTPVYLRPDQDRLLLFDVEDLNLTLAESKGLAKLFNDHFIDEGWQVEVPHPHRWYLSLAEEPDLKTYELTDVFGRNMDLFLPEGEEGIRWHGVLNEIQMLFYTSELNAQREQSGKGPVNGLWLSGGGKSHSQLQTGMSALYGDSALLRGLASTAGTPVETLPDRLDGLCDASGGEILVCYELLRRPVLCADPFAWSEQLIQLQNWIEPLLDGLRQKRLNSLFLYPCNGQQYRIDRHSLRRFWKRPSPLSQRLDSNPLV
ncbi:hypothetical protein AAY24_06025 [Sedimenticola thiotaurini]|uniref:Phosphoglycerate mutase n=2 Tax=Sedimenticola thiotaurini TaxID=1543721 RepID=A0A0F7K3K1_9GAMM|nr:hypothetical protein AAY24_06025 [Sedimenticola thiotaurini]